MKKKQKTKPKKLSDEFAELEEAKNEEMMSAKERKQPSFWSDFKGVKRGTIIDVSVEERERRPHKAIKLGIQCEDGKVTRTIQNTGEYNQSNPFARFLAWYDVETRDPSRLIDLDVTFLKRRQGWKLYIPESLDKYTRYRHFADMIARKIGITFVWESSFYELSVISVIAFITISIFSAPASNILLYTGVLDNGLTAYLLTTVVLTLVLSFVPRIHTVLKRRAKRAKEKEDLV